MIKLRNLERIYKRPPTATRVLWRVNLTIRQGEFVTVVGPSGAGKSSLLHVLAMLDEQWQGEFSFANQPVHTMDRSQRWELARRCIGFVRQDEHLPDDLTVEQSLGLPLTRRHVPHSERQSLVAGTLDSFHITQKKNLYPNQLSSGQQQLVRIARVLIHKPSVLLADEPTGSLDSTQARETMKRLRQLNANGTTIIQVTHTRKYATYGTRMIELAAGRIVSDSARSPRVFA
jgi:putative ABC transport system ATP-binding protein